MSRSSQSLNSGGGHGSDPSQATCNGGYYAYRHPYSDYENEENGPFGNYASAPAGQEDHNYDYDGGEEWEGNGVRGRGSVSVQNGALNLHIPLAYSYNVPVSAKISDHQKRDRGHSNCRNSQNKLKSPKSRGKSKNKSKSSSGHPFVSTVKSGDMLNAKAKSPKQCPPSRSSASSSRLQNKCSRVWDLSRGNREAFRVLDYGQELYEQAAQNLAKSLEEQSLADLKNSSAVLAEDNCWDFSKPGVYSSKFASKALEDAIETLKDIPKGVESSLKKDRRFNLIAVSEATKTMNVPLKSKIYKDLIPLQQNPELQAETQQVEAEIRKTIEAARQPSRERDPEPKLEDYQSNGYTRMRPSPVQPPSRPSAGISISSGNHFSTVTEERNLEEESSRLDV